MRSCFRALERRRVRYLLISGQATVLYGASTFSEDIDLWIEPTPANWSRLLIALEDCNARVYKLTPPLELQFVIRGHGFHFVLPPKRSSRELSYVDVLGVPPRVDSFEKCYRRSVRFTTEWGCLPVVSPHDLVLLKRTRRLADYAVISALVRIACRRVRSRTQWEWGLHQTFEAEDLISIWRRGRADWRKTLRSKRPAIRALLANPGSPSSSIQLSRQLANEIEAARQKDRNYWQPVIAELKQMQRQGKLLTVGTPVRAKC